MASFRQLKSQGWALVCPYNRYHKKILNEEKFNVNYSIVIFWPTLMITILWFYYEFKFNIESLNCIEVINFSENRERQRKAYERKKSFPLQWRKIDSDEFFPVGKRSLCLRLRKASAVVCQRKNVLAPFCYCKYQVEH